MSYNIQESLKISLLQIKKIRDKQRRQMCVLTEKKKSVRFNDQPSFNDTIGSTLSRTTYDWLFLFKHST